MGMYAYKADWGCQVDEESPRGVDLRDGLRMLEQEECQSSVHPDDSRSFRGAIKNSKKGYIVPFLVTHTF